MDEQKFREQLHHAAETRLSGLQGDPWLAQRVMAQAKGEARVKKKAIRRIDIVADLSRTDSHSDCSVPAVGISIRGAGGNRVSCWLHSHG